MSICILTWVNEKFCKCELEESLGADKSAVSTIHRLLRDWRLVLFIQNEPYLSGE
ncbi:MAG TPA: hypothetical protein VEL49_08440 [Ktedonobacteraceae bacterium]|nr:hypothetical protein [Ktedonobacteraceae bacterium]